MDDLVQFLRDRLDEREAQARAVHDAWVVSDAVSKRRIVDLMAETLSAAKGDSEVDHYGALGNADDTLALLALPYSQHPDYRDEWRPQP